MQSFSNHAKTQAVITSVLEGNNYTHLLCTGQMTLVNGPQQSTGFQGLEVEVSKHRPKATYLLALTCA